MCEGESHSKAAEAAGQSPRHSLGAERYIPTLHPVTQSDVTQSDVTLCFAFGLLKCYVYTMQQDLNSYHAHSHWAQLMS